MLFWLAIIAMLVAATLYAVTKFQLIRRAGNLADRMASYFEL